MVICDASLLVEGSNIIKMVTVAQETMLPSETTEIEAELRHARRRVAQECNKKNNHALMAQVSL